MDVAVDLYVAVPLLFTVLAVILASVFVRLRSSEEDKATEPAAKEEGEAKASAAAGERTDGEALLKDEREPVAAGAEPRKEKGEEKEEEAVISREAERGAVEEIGAAEEEEEEEEEGTNEEKGEELREKGKGEEDEAAPEAVKAEQRSHVQVERKVPGQAERDAVVAAPVALEEQEEDEEEEDEEEDDEDDDDEEESKEEDQESENEKLVVKEPETEDADEKFSFKYSPGKLRGNQYKTMMTKEELEEEQRTEDYMKLSLDSS